MIQVPTGGVEGDAAGVGGGDGSAGFAGCGGDDFAADCKACQAKLRAAQADLADGRAG